MKNKFGYFGLIGFIGILGLVTDNHYLLAFFSFFVFFRYFFVIPDELFKLNIQRAATSAFFTGITIQIITIAISAFTKSSSYLITGYSLSFSISIALFIFILVIAEFKELKER